MSMLHAVQKAKTQRRGRKPTAGRPLKFITTRLPQEVVTKVKVICAMEERTFQDYLTAALEEKLARR